MGELEEEYKKSVQASYRGIMKNNLLLHISEYGYYKQLEGAAAMTDKDNEKFFAKEAERARELIYGYIKEL